MLSRLPYLTVEITRTADRLLRVVFSHSDRPAQQVQEHPFDPEAAERVAAELAGRIAAAAAQETAEAWESGLGRLAARLAGMILPGAVADGLASGLPVEFVLDDYCMAFPVEALPGGGGPLGSEVPVVRRWLCDVLPRERRERRGGVEMLIVADPAGSHPAARREGQAVLRFMREANPDWRIRYLSRQVSRAKLDDELPDTDIFHIAAHMDDSPPGVRVADGLWLPTPDSAAPGVVVAACCRAGGLNSAGRELAGRFLRAGTRQVVAPYAAVSDRLAEFFSRELYREIAAGGSLAKAVLAARAILGPAGLAFIHYGTMTEQLPAPRAAHAEPGKSRKKPLLVVASLALLAAALLALSFWIGRSIPGGAVAKPSPAPVAAAPREREPAASEPPPPSAAAPTTAPADVRPAEANRSDKQPVKRTGEEAKRTSETEGKNGRLRVAEKLLENF